MVFAALALTGPLLLSATPASAAFPPFFDDSLVVGGFSTPRGLAFFPNGSQLVVENGGGIVFVSNGARSLLGTFTGLETSGEQGLLGVAIDPDYPTRPHIYVHYTTTRPPSYVQIARINLTNADGGGPLGLDLGSRFVLLADMPNVNTNHNGGTVRFGPDKHLYISIGDDAQASGCTAQNLSFTAGKILRIKVDDTIDPADRLSLAPLDNPFYSPADANASLVWALGLRNPFRFDIDPVTGKLYIGDVGQSAWEEVDVSAGGENFGWPYFEGNHTYRSTLCPGQSAFPASTLPIYEYPNPGPGSVIAAALYRGAAYPNDASLPPAFDENPFFFDFYTGNLRVLRADANGTGWALVPGVDATNFATQMAYVTDMRVGPDGALWWISAATNELRRLSYQSVPEILTSSLPPGTVGTAYDASLMVAGNAPPYTFSIANGTLPDGLSLGVSTGQISGTPSLASGFSFTVEVQSAVGRVGSKNLSIVVADPVSIAPDALPDAVQDANYVAPLAALGGVPPYAWALESGALPPGFSLTQGSGHISGSCPDFGNWTFTVRATDADGRFATKAFTLRVIEQLRFVTTVLPQGLQGAWYEATLVASGGTPPYAWDKGTLVALPPGLSLDTSNGTVSGTPTSPSASSIPFEVRDSAGQFASRSIDLVIAPPPGEAPLIATVTLPVATTELSYQLAFQVAAGVSPFNWTVVRGSFPPGLLFDASMATLEGVPTVVGSFAFGLRVTDSFGRWDERNYTLQVEARFRALTVTTAALVDGELGVLYGPIQLEAAGLNFTLPLRWSSTALPLGLTLTEGGVVAGTPGAAGAFLVTFVATDSSPTPVAAQAHLALNITRLEITTLPALTDLPAGQAVVLPIELSSASPGASWTVAAGILPPGLRLDSDGVIRGTPTQPGNYTFTIRAAHPLAPTNFAEQAFTVEVTGSPPPVVDGGTGLPIGWVLLGLGAVALIAVLAMTRRRRGES